MVIILPTMKHLLTLISLFFIIISLTGCAEEPTMTGLEAERRALIYGWIAIGAILMVMIGAAVILWQRVERKKLLLNLRDAIDDIEELRMKMNDIGPHNPMIVRTAPESTKISDVNREIILIEKFKSDLLSKFGDVSQNKESYDCPETLMRSEAYKNLMKVIESKKTLPPHDRLWKQLDKAVSKSCPEFKQRLKYLLGEKMKSSDHHTILLIKCGVSPAEMATLFSITVSSVGSRRIAISERIYGKNVGAAVIDAIIRSL